MNPSMHTPQQIGEARPDAIDPQFESLLDAALAVTPPAGLANRVVAATEARLMAPAPSVLARLGPTLMGLAAMLLLAVGTAAWIAAFDQNPGSAGPGDGARSRLAEIQAIDAARDADIDEQITLLALQVDLAERDDWWAPADEGLERATLQYQLEALSGDPAIF